MPQQKTLVLRPYTYISESFIPIANLHCISRTIIDGNIFQELVWINRNFKPSFIPIDNTIAGSKVISTV